MCIYEYVLHAVTPVPHPMPPLLPFSSHDTDNQVFKHYVVLDLFIFVVVIVYSFLCLRSIIGSCILTKVGMREALLFTHPASTSHSPPSPYTLSLHLWVSSSLPINPLLLPLPLSPPQNAYKFFRSRYDKRLTWGHIKSMQNFWFYFVILGNLLVALGTILKITLAFKVSGNRRNLTHTSLLRVLHFIITQTYNQFTPVFSCCFCLFCAVCVQCQAGGHNHPHPGPGGVLSVVWAAPIPQLL